jgi:DNA-binding NtrC family response regulator
MSRRILVVDDDRNMTRTLADILRRRGWQADTAHSGEEAVQATCLEHYPVVLMDIRMEGISGVEAFKAMKNCPPAPRVVLMTAHTSAETLAEAQLEGAYRVIHKPIDLPLLLTLLE